MAFWYTALFGVSSLGLFLVSYFYLQAAVGRLTDAELVETGAELRRLYRDSGLGALRKEMRREAESWGQERAFFVLRAGRGRILASSELRAWGRLQPLPQPNLSKAGGDRTLATLAAADKTGSLRLLTLPIGDGITLQIGQTLAENQRIMREFRRAFLAALSIMLVCGGAVGFLVAGRAMSGVRNMAAIASHIGKENLGDRVPLHNKGQEIDDLARAFNAMLERVESLVHELREVTDNIAHDLRGPITRIRGMAEAASTTREDASTYREVMAAIVGESDRLVVMINTMLEITETEAGVVPMAGQAIDLRALLRDAQELFVPLAASGEVSLRLKLPEGQVSVSGDRSKLQRVVANLLDNAVKYTPLGGHVIMSLEARHAEACITVADTGSGIDENELGHIFERFHRGDKSRSTQGNGLGLSLARAIVRAHHGDITVESVRGEGSRFSVRLPWSGALGRNDANITKR